MYLYCSFYLICAHQQVNNGIDQSSSASATALALPLTELAGVELDGSVAGPDSDASDDVSVDLDMQSECTEEQVHYQMIYDFI